MKGPVQIFKKKLGGGGCFWGPRLIALAAPRYHEVEAILTMKAKQNNNLSSLSADNSQWRISRRLQYT